MKKECEKNRLELRGELYVGIASLLGVHEKRKSTFFFEIENKLGLKSGNLFNWKQRGFPTKEDFEIETLWQAVEDTVTEFITDTGIPLQERETVIKNWAEQSEAIRKGMAATFFEPENLGKNSMATVLKTMGEAVKTLPPLFAYKLFANFGCYISITVMDYKFLTALTLGSSEGRRQLAEMIATAEMRPAVDIIKSLMSVEGKQWEKIRNNGYEYNFKNGNNPSSSSWALFQEKALSLSTDKLIGLVAVITLIWPDESGLSPLGTDEIDQLLAFKYCLTENAQEKNLTYLETQA